MSLSLFLRLIHVRTVCELLIGILVVEVSQLLDHAPVVDLPVLVCVLADVLMEDVCALLLEVLGDLRAALDHTHKVLQVHLVLAVLVY